MGTLYLVRHGQASFLAEEYDRLSDLGRKQSRLLGAYWQGWGERLDAIYSGPLERQKGSAQEAVRGIRERGGSPAEPVVLEGWNEYPGVVMVKKYLPVFLERRPDVAALLAGVEDPVLQRKRFQQAFEIVMRDWLHGKLGIEGIESWPSFTARVRGGLDEILGRHPSGARVAVFTSGGAIAAALQQVLGIADEVTLEMSWVIKNGAYAEIRYSSGRRTLAGFNETPHLATPDLVTYR